MHPLIVGMYRLPKQIVRPAPPGQPAPPHGWTPQTFGVRAHLAMRRIRARGARLASAVPCLGFAHRAFTHFTQLHCYVVSDVALLCSRVCGEHEPRQLI